MNNYFDMFEATDKTVADFNAIFTRSKLYYPLTSSVTIGKLVQGGFREVFVDGEVVLHEILPPRIPVEPVVREKRERKVAEKITYSSYEMQDIDMPASLFKLWHILKQQTSNWHTEEKLASVTGYSKKKVRMCLRELRDMEKIELETSTQGIKITLRSYLC